MIKTIATKKELRKQALLTREKFVSTGYNADISSHIVSKILSSTDFINSENIALYMPIRGEIDITSIMSVKDKKFYLPRCSDLNLDFVRYDNLHKMKIGKWNILEPIGQPIEPNILDIIYVPALIANQNNFRLGYGKGYYDRFFSKNKINAKKIIVVAKQLITNSFKEDKFDYRLDGIICE